MDGVGDAPAPGVGAGVDADEDAAGDELADDPA